jgi:predicted TIM-barrel fold metal-dependent hydrolase
MALERQQSFKAPPGACDCHFHVFGDSSRYPLSPDRRNTPPPASALHDYLRIARRLGIERMVFVQPSTYGRDNSCLVDAMKAVAPYGRGIVDIDENAPEAEMWRLHAAGARGVRINAGRPNLEPAPGLLEKILPRVKRLDARCAEIGWQLDFLGPSWLYEEMFEMMKGLKCRFTIAHMAMFKGASGVASPGFQRLLGLLRQGERRAWVKLTAPYRIAEPPLFEHALPVARALIEAAPDRVIWGSDYPFLSHSDRVTLPQLIDLVAQWAPDESVRRRILVDNPQRLYDFG